ncbi:MAG TPA: hypothetical protein VI730_01905 [Burkholderiales bacterium]|nr:hypothetical protein [Burkholderiales bacterium]
MGSTLLLVQFASQNIALFCCALFAGAATYVSLVEHPTMTEGGLKLEGIYLLTSHPRPVVFQTSFGTIGSLSGILAGLAGADLWWSAGGGVLAAATLLQVFAVIPLSRRILDIDPQSDPRNAIPLYETLTKLHAAQSLAGLAALFIFITND